MEGVCVGEAFTIYLGIPLKHFCRYNLTICCKAPQNA